MKIDKREIQGLLKSFWYAFRGLWICIKNERNMRIHIVISLSVLLFSTAYGLTRLQYAALFLAYGLVIMAEMMNTAVEALVDLQSPAYDHLARIAKDVAAGAVLISAGAAIVVGICLFFHWEKLCAAFLTIFTSPVYLILYAILLTVGILFIFKGVELFRPNQRKKS